MAVLRAVKCNGFPTGYCKVSKRNPQTKSVTIRQNFRFNIRAASAYCLSEKRPDWTEGENIEHLLVGL
jgi:hypothetical protein